MIILIYMLLFSIIINQTLPKLRGNNSLPGPGMLKTLSGQVDYNSYNLLESLGYYGWAEDVIFSHWFRNAVDLWVYFCPPGIIASRSQALPGW